MTRPARFLTIERSGATRTSGPDPGIRHNNSYPIPERASGVKGLPAVFCGIRSARTLVCVFLLTVRKGSGDRL